MRVAIFLFFISLGKFAPSVMPPTLAEHLLILAEHPLTQTEPLFLQSGHLLIQSEHPLILAEPLLILAEPPFLQAELPSLLAELPLKLIAHRDTVIANHEISVSSHETVISCPAFPIMVISIMTNSRSAPLCTKTTIAASTRYGLVLAAIGRVGCCVVAGIGSVPALSCCVPVPFCCVVAGIGSGGVDGSVHNLAQRFHDEVALVHQRVGNVQVGLVDVQVVVDEYVDVDGTVVILPVGRLALAAQLPLYLLGGGEHLAGCERGAAAHTGVEEPVGGVKAPRLGFQKD